MQRLGILNVSAIMSRAWTPPSHDSPAYHALQRAIARPSRLWSQIRTMIEGWDDVVSGLYWKAFEKARPLRLYTARFMTEQAPNRDSRVTLGDERDALGMPMAKLDWRLKELDYHSIRMASRQLAVELGRSGLGRMQPWCAQESDEEIDRRITPGAHHMGTTRMHSDPSRGVVDTECRVHGTRNVYVASSSVFPTARPCGSDDHHRRAGNSPGTASALGPGVRLRMAMTRRRVLMTLASAAAAGAAMAQARLLQTAPAIHSWIGSEWRRSLEAIGAAYVRQHRHGAGRQAVS